MAIWHLRHHFLCQFTGKLQQDDVSNILHNQLKLLSIFWQVNCQHEVEFSWWLWIDSDVNKLCMQSLIFSSPQHSNICSVHSTIKKSTKSLKSQRGGFFCILTALWIVQDNKPATNEFCNWFAHQLNKRYSWWKEERQLNYSSVQLLVDWPNLKQYLDP